MEARWAALVVLTTARASMGFQFQSLASVSPMLVRDLGIGYADVGFLIGLYMLPGIALALPGGVLGQRFGDKRMVGLGLGLMAAGGVLSGLAETYVMLMAGRFVSGVGAILLNVLMSKMVTDWFAGREITLAMAVFVNSFPIGIGLALLSLGAVAAALRWQVAFHATAAAALASLLLVAFVYRPHANDGKASAPGSGQRISRRETALVCIAGAIWGLYNGAFAVMVGFAPNVLVAAGLTTGAASSLVGLTTWLLVASVHAGGIMAQRWGHPNALMLIGIGSWGIGMLLLPTVDPLILVAIGILQGLPVGVIMSLPAEVLRPESRAVGMGLFYT